MRNEHQTSSLLSWLNRHRCKNGLPIIYLRITVDMKRVEISTTRQVGPKLWDQAG